VKSREVSTVQNPALLAVGARPDVLPMRVQSGIFRSMDDPRRVVRVGQPGVPDSMLFIAVTIQPWMVGRTVAVAAAGEFKTASGRQSEAQRNWQAAFEARGGVYRLVRSADDMRQLVQEVQDGTAFGVREVRP
jgi:hypothetical protein